MCNESEGKAVKEGGKKVSFVYKPCSMYSFTASVQIAGTDLWGL